MKKLLGLVILAVSLTLSSAAYSQSKAKEEVKKDAKKVGNKTAEVASKGKAKVTDEVYKDKVGPDGQTVYIDNHSKYYWVDKKGHRHYATDAELKAKTKD
jgi:protein involved in sex pheromone biosynthesis